MNVQRLQRRIERYSHFANAVIILLLRTLCIGG